MFKNIKKYVLRFIMILLFCGYMVVAPYFSFQLNEFMKTNNIFYGE